MKLPYPTDAGCSRPCPTGRDVLIARLRLSPAQRVALPGSGGSEAIIAFTGFGDKGVPVGSLLLWEIQDLNCVFVRIWIVRVAYIQCVYVPPPLSLFLLLCLSLGLCVCVYVSVSIFVPVCLFLCRVCQSVCLFV